MALVMTPIFTQTASTSSSLLSFNSIPQFYTDLMLMMSVRTTGTTSNQGVYVQLGGDGGNNYSATFLRGNGSNTDTFRTSNTNAINEIQVPNASNTASTFSNVQIYFPNYTSSNFKQFTIEAVKENNAAATDVMMSLIAGLWRNTNPITKIDIGTNIAGPNYAANSTFSLYGIIRSGA